MSRSRQPSGPEIRTVWVSYASRFTWRGYASDWGQLIFASRGAMTVTTSTGVWVVPRHQALWLPPRVCHDVEVPGESAMRRVYVKPPFTRRLPTESRVIAVSPLLRELPRRVFQLKTLERGRAAERNLMEVLLDELAVLPIAPIDLPMPSDARALRAAQRVRESPAARHDIATLAGHAGASGRTLERPFRQETGSSFGAWRQRARMFRALQLLADDTSVTATALAVGYDSTSAFVSAFRKTMGTTPASYFRSQR